jgi:L-threonylcarbamoyladenylate synthase
VISTDINLAAELLQREEIIGLPTETVYGLAGNIFSEKAIKKIFETKKRPYYNPLIVHIKGIGDLPLVAKHIPSKAKRLAEEFWPGPLTLLLEKNDTIPSIVTAGKNTVAVRVPDHPMALRLLSILDFPLAAPSANPFGSISPTHAMHVENYFRDVVSLVLDGGASKKGVESTIIGFEEDEPVVYRYGAIAIEDIEKVIGKLRIFNKEEQAPLAPGMLLKHYSPRTPTILSDNIDSSLRLYKDKKAGLLLFDHQRDGYDAQLQLVLSPSSSMEEAAANLYAFLHQLDEKKLDLIICEKMKEEGLGRTINDRLIRASVDSID